MLWKYIWVDKKRETNGSDRLPNLIKLTQVTGQSDCFVNAPHYSGEFLYNTNTNYHWRNNALPPIADLPKRSIDGNVSGNDWPTQAVVGETKSFVPYLALKRTILIHQRYGSSKKNWSPITSSVIVGVPLVVHTSLKDFFSSIVIYLKTGWRLMRQKLSCHSVCFPCNIYYILCFGCSCIDLWLDEVFVWVMCKNDFM